MNPVTADVLRAVAPRLFGAAAKKQSQIIDAIAGDFSSILDEYEINTLLRVAHFLAQIVHESAGLQTTEEFASGAAYEGRVDLGNTVRGDGRRYKGRGVLQLTGRANYRRYGKILGFDLEGQPHIAAEPLVSLRIACVYWRDRQINPLCDADDLVGVTRKVNGGTNGLADRGRYLAKAKAALAHAASPAVAVVTANASGAGSTDVAPASGVGMIASLTSVASSAATINQLSDDGSRIALTIRKLKGWFWRGTATASVGGTALATLPAPDEKSGGIIQMAMASHPYWVLTGLACFAVLLAVLFYFGIKLVERYLVTAARDGRYSPQ